MATTTSKKHSKLDKQDVTQGLTQLHAPVNFDTNPQCVDIVAVPGLGSDMTHTWVMNKVHWLKDKAMLPKVIPNARITVFGYRSQWYGPDAVEIRLPTISDDLLHSIKLDRKESKNKKRPIIFVGHSLGGLVVAKAVSKAKRQPEDFPGIIDCITACVFLATPFRGSESQPFAKIIGMAGSTLGIAKYSGLVRTLKSGSTELDDLADEFLGDISKAQIDVECYFELEKTNGMVIADQRSSTFEGRPKHSWARAHTEMNKFDGPKDVNYKDLSSTLQDLAQQSFKKIKLRQDAVRQEIVNDSRVEKILEALDVINSKKDVEAIRRVSGIATGTASSWMQNDDKYLAWRNDPSSQILWICGGPGKGKTIAAISMVEELSQLRSNDGDRDDSLVLAHFFCDEQEKDKSKALNVVKCLAWQLLKAKRYLIRHFFGEDNKPKGGTQKQKGDSTASVYEYNSLPDLWKCLKAALSDQSLGTVYFLVNGLDQIDSVSRKEFLSLITSFQPRVQGDGNDTSGPLLKWLFLSVHRDDILEALQHTMILNLDDGSNSTRQDDDLRAYVSQKISKLAKEKRYSLSLEYFVKSFISFRAKGKSNYDWVNLVCLELGNDKLQHNAIRRHLESLPSDLYPMYDQVSHRVLSTSDIEVEYTKDILRSLLLVHWPPTLYELAVISGLPEEDRMNKKAILGYVQRCGAFTTTFEDSGKLKVQLSHTSVREFLKSKYNDWLSMGSEQIQHGIIALRCFEYVLNTIKRAEADDQNISEKDATDTPEDSEEDETDDEIESLGSVKSDDRKTSARKEKPLEYPYTQWIEHALEATADIVENFGLEDVFWVLESKERAEWSKLYSKLNPDPESDFEFDANFTAIHVAAYFGYVPLADLLLKTGTHDKEIHTADSYGHQPLFWACSGGHMNMVQKLCEAGADVNFRQKDEKDGLTALHGAVWSGNSEITEYLLNHKAVVDIPNKNYGSPLYIAAEDENLTIVQNLLSSKADPNLTGGEDITPLNAAAGLGNLEIVRLLVENGAYLNPAVEYEYGNALGIACLLGKKEVAEYLLQHHCDFNKKDSEGCSPLEYAATGGYVEIMQALLRYDLDPESHRRALVTAVEEQQMDFVGVLLEKCPHVRRSEAFHTAASSGYTKILEMLTSNGIEPEILEKSLYEAADFQHQETVSLLLDMGVNPNAEGEEYGNALQASSFDGTTGILKLLLGKGAHPNRSYMTSAYGTALQAACFEGNIDNVRLLIEHGARVNTEICGRFGTPLQAACSKGRTEIVQLLLEHGADPNAKGGFFEYAIIAATHRGHGEILELLIRFGAEVNVTNPEDGCTPLINAAMELPKSSVELLVNHGALLHLHDHDNDTALTSAAASGGVETVLYLLDLGSDIQNIGRYGGALYRATEVAAIDCMRVLLERNIDVNQEGGDMNTSLQVAAALGELECVNLLLEHNADVHRVGGKYHTALQASILASTIEIAQLLLGRNADPNEIGGKYGTALHAAVGSDEAIKFIDLLLEHGADINIVAETGTALQLACVISDTDVVLHLLDNGADPNISGGKFGTALQASCFMATEEEVDLLLDRGADPFIKGGLYGSALNAAAAVGFEEILKKVLARGPLPDMLAEALHYAAHYRERDAVEILLDHGADITARSQFYTSAFQALDADLSPEERKEIDSGGYDDWFDDDEEEEDDDDDDDDDLANNEGKEDSNNENDDDGDDGTDEDEDEDEGVEEIDKEKEAKAKEEIKRMLEEALSRAHEQMPALRNAGPIQYSPDVDKGPVYASDQSNRPVSPFSYEEPVPSWLPQEPDAESPDHRTNHSAFQAKPVQRKLLPGSTGAGFQQSQASNPGMPYPQGGMGRGFQQSQDVSQGMQYPQYPQSGMGHGFQQSQASNTGMQHPQSGGFQKGQDPSQGMQFPQYPQIGMGPGFQQSQASNTGMQHPQGGGFQKGQDPSLGMQYPQYPQIGMGPGFQQSQAPNPGIQYPQSGTGRGFQQSQVSNPGVPYPQYPQSGIGQGFQQSQAPSPRMHYPQSAEHGPSIYGAYNPGPGGNFGTEYSSTFSGGSDSDSDEVVDKVKQGLKKRWKKFIS